MTDEAPNTTRIEVDPRRGLVEVEFRGHYDLREWLEVIRAVDAGEGYQPGMDSLHDATGAHFDFTEDDVRVLTEWVTERIHRWGSGYRHATVVSNEVMEELCESILAWFTDAPFEARVFRSREEALAWIAGPRSA